LKRNITKYTLKKATEHLCYETSMFYQTLMILTQPHSQVEVNILLDSFAIHTRNLFDFFYPKQKSKKNPKIKFKKDDTFAFDYLDSPGNFKRDKTKKKYLRFILRKVDKQVAHLTYTRNRYNPKTKPWPFVDICQKMYKTLKAFYEELPNSYKKWPYILELKKVIDSIHNNFNT